jgi:hypothetical protein
MTPPEPSSSPSIPPTWIAEEPVVFVYPDGSRKTGRIAIGLPERVDAGHAQCCTALDGLSPPPGSTFGASPLQALVLALQLTGFELHRFVSLGGRVLDPTDDSAFHLESLFGPLLRSAPPYAPPTD